MRGDIYTHKVCRSFPFLSPGIDLYQIPFTLLSVNVYQLAVLFLQRSHGGLAGFLSAHRPAVTSSFCLRQCQRKWKTSLLERCGKRVGGCVEGVNCCLPQDKVNSLLLSGLITRDGGGVWPSPALFLMSLMTAQVMIGPFTATLTRWRRTLLLYY